MRITHANVWRKRPTKKHSFVSNQVYLTFSTLKKIKAKKLLDIACGNGLGVSIPLMKQGYDVYSFDKWKASIAALEINAKAAGFRSKGKVSDMYKKFPYPSNTFDASFCFQAIYHGTLDQIESAFREIKRVTKKGGYFFATFIPYYIISNDGKPYFLYTMPNGKDGRIYVKQDPKDPLLCYNLSKDVEYMVPHYYFTKTKLRSTLKKYFREIRIKIVKREEKYSDLLFVRCRI